MVRLSIMVRKLESISNEEIASLGHFPVRILLYIQGQGDEKV